MRAVHSQQGLNPKWEEQGWDWNAPDWNKTERRLSLFASYFGPVHRTFLYRNVRFTGFFAAVAGTGLSYEQRLWPMLERLPDLPAAQHHVAVMHYWPFIVPGDDQCEEFDSYGPWGHPTIDQRDYTVAREQPPLEPD